MAELARPITQEFSLHVAINRWRRENIVATIKPGEPPRLRQQLEAARESMVKESERIHISTGSSRGPAPGERYYREDIAAIDVILGELKDDAP